MKTAKMQQAFEINDRVVLVNDRRPYCGIRPGTPGTVVPASEYGEEDLVAVKFDGQSRVAMVAGRLAHLAEEKPVPKHFIWHVERDPFVDVPITVEHDQTQSSDHVDIKIGGYVVSLTDSEASRLISSLYAALAVQARARLNIQQHHPSSQEDHR